MKRINRRTLVGGATAAAGGMAAGSTVVKAGPATRSTHQARMTQDGPVEIVFHHIWGTPPGAQPSDKPHPSVQVIDAFNAQSTNVKVVSRTDSGSYYEVLQKTQAELAAGNGPALVSTPWANIHWANEGLGLVDLDDIAGDELSSVLGNLREEVVPLVQIDGRTKGLPYAFSCPVLYYNQDILDQAGVDPAVLFKDWATFAQEAPKIQDVLDGNPVLGLAGGAWPSQSIIQSNGGQIMSSDGTFTVASPESIEAMQTIADLDTAGLTDPSTADEQRQSFIGGSIAVYFSSIASLSGLRNEIGFDLQVSGFPHFTGKDRRMSAGGSFIGVYARDEAQQAGAWEFLKYAVSEEGYTPWMQTGYLNASIYDIPVLPGQEAAYEQLEEGLTPEVAWPTERGGELQDTWSTYVQRIWANDISAEEGCTQAQEELNGMIG